MKQQHVIAMIEAKKQSRKHPLFWKGRKVRSLDCFASLAMTCCVLAVVILFSACTPEKKLKESEFLLVKNKVAADNKAVPVSDKIAYVVQPRPNKRTFGLFLTKASIYQSIDTLKNPRFEHIKRKMRNTFGQYPVLLDTVSNDYLAYKWKNAKLWIQDNFGEPPVLLDSGLVDYSVNQINLMMRKIGYFNANTDYSVTVNRKQRARVSYHITAGTPYRITDIQYLIADTVVARIILSDTNRSLLQRGMLFDDYVLDDERTRLEERITNRGYYYFTKNNIRYEADTSLGDSRVSLRMIVQNPQFRAEDSSFVETNFRCYKIQSIDIYADAPESEYSRYDTILYTEIVNKTDTNLYRIFLPAGSQLYKPSALVYPLFFQPNDVYSNWRFRNSYDRYIDMRNFGYTKISFIESEENKTDFQQDTGGLDCKVQLIKLKRHNYEYDFSAKNTGGIYGVGGSATYRNRNLFRAGEIFSLTARYTQELQVDSVWHFRNFEAGLNASIEFPRFLFPDRLQKLPKNYRPKTLINVGANFIRHDYYSRLLLSTNLTYHFSQRVNAGKYISHTLTAIDFGVIKMYNDSIFNVLIREHNFTNRMKEKYKDHFMLGSKYGFTVQRGNLYVLRTQFNLYGNLLYFIMKGLDAARAPVSQNDYNQYTIWKIPFESCIAADFDFVYNLMQQKRNALVYRLAVGVGYPTFNSSVLPYEKSFFLGGSNSMRAWRLRALGPGSFTDTTESRIMFERVGDVKFETNLEYRTPIYKYFTFGAFVDVGNIWLIRKSTDFPNGEFAFNRFYKELAVDVGIGLRIDLSFAIIRVDYALKIHDPAKLASNGWQTFNWANYDNFKADRAIVFGIGYPF